MTSLGTGIVLSVARARESELVCWHACRKELYVMVLGCGVGCDCVPSGRRCVVFRVRSERRLMASVMEEVLAYAFMRMFIALVSRGVSEAWRRWNSLMATFGLFSVIAALISVEYVMMLGAMEAHEGWFATRVRIRLKRRRARR